MYINHNIEHGLMQLKMAKTNASPICSSLPDFGSLCLNSEYPSDLTLLHIGDPTLYGNLPCGHVAKDAVVQLMKNFDGYCTIDKIEKAKSVVAEYEQCSSEYPLEPKDILLTSGCSEALEMAISVLADPGQNVLIPCPGFETYGKICKLRGVVCKLYNLLPSRNWNIDLDDLESELDEQTAAIIVNTPSNPCGSVFSKENILETLSIAERYKVPIIADDVYKHIVFGEQEHFSFPMLSHDVPILSCNSLAKRFMVPGWRIGWLVIHDRHGAFEAEVRKGLLALAERHSYDILLAALPDIIQKTSSPWFLRTTGLIQANATAVHTILSNVPGLCPVMPQGSMFMFVQIDMDSYPQFSSTAELIAALVAEKSIIPAAGLYFDFPSAFRLTLTLPEDKMREASQEIADFCKNHYQGQLSH